MRLRTWLAADDGTYLSVLAVTVVVARALDFLWPSADLVRLPLATVCMLVGGVATLAVWVVFRPRARWDSLTYVFLAFWLLAWATAVWASVRHGDNVDASLVVVPLVLALVAAKRPSGPAVTRAVDVLAWATAALFVGVLVAQQTGLLDRAGAGTSTPWDAMNYWVPLSDPLGFVGRWIGPFRTPNVTASAAVLLVVWGASRGWVTRISLMGVGALVLLLTGTRSSAFAAIAGVAVLVLLWPARHRAYRVVQWIAGCAAGLAFILGTMFWVERNPSISGRAQIWPVFVDLWRSDPAGGVGDSGVGLAVEDGRLPAWATHAHDIFMDPLARNGIVALLVILAVLGLAVAIGVRAARRGRPTGIALVVALLVGGLTETLFDWRYLGYQLAVLLAATLVAAAYLRPAGRVLPTQLGRRTPRTPEALRRADALVAVDAATMGMQVVRARFRGALTIHAKPGEDFATDVDEEAERAVRDVLAFERPDDAVTGEELGGTPAVDGRGWLVDPLCGTVNYAAGLPLVATNVALSDGGAIDVAAQGDPIHDEVFWTDGSGAWRWRVPSGVDVAIRPDATHGIVAVDSQMAPARTAALLTDPGFAQRFRPLMVSTSLAASWVADGRLAAYVGEDLVDGNLHYAAGFAVARAAGCVASDLYGRPLGPTAQGFVLAADAQTHAALLAILRD